MSELLLSLVIGIVGLCGVLFSCEVLGGIRDDKKEAQNKETAIEV